MSETGYEGESEGERQEIINPYLDEWFQEMGAPSEPENCDSSDKGEMEVDAASSKEAEMGTISKAVKEDKLENSSASTEERVEEDICNSPTEERLTENTFKASSELYFNPQGEIPGPITSATFSAPELCMEVKYELVDRVVNTTVKTVEIVKEALMYKLIKKADQPEQDTASCDATDPGTGSAPDSNPQTSNKCEFEKCGQMLRYQKGRATQKYSHDTNRILTRMIKDKLWNRFLKIMYRDFMKKGTPDNGNKPNLMKNHSENGHDKDEKFLRGWELFKEFLDKEDTNIQIFLIDSHEEIQKSCEASESHTKTGNSEMDEENIDAAINAMFKKILYPEEEEQQEDAGMIDLESAADWAWHEFMEHMSVIVDHFLTAEYVEFDRISKARNPKPSDGFELPKVFEDQDVPRHNLLARRDTFENLEGNSVMEFSDDSLEDILMEEFHYFNNNVADF